MPTLTPAVALNPACPPSCSSPFPLLLSSKTPPPFDTQIVSSGRRFPQQNKNFEALTENNAIESLSYTSNVSNYFMQFYKQGNHVWGNAFTKTTVFSDKTTIEFSADNFNGQQEGALRLFCKLQGNILSLNENVQHIIGTGVFRFDQASALYTYPIQVVAIYNGTDTEIRVPFTSVSSPRDVRYEFVVDTVL